MPPPVNDPSYSVGPRPLDRRTPAKSPNRGKSKRNVLKLIGALKEILVNPKMNRPR